MDAIDNSKSTMYIGFRSLTLKDTSIAIYGTNKGFSAVHAKFLTAHDDLNAKALAAGVNLTGFTTTKDDDKTTLAQQMAMLCGFAYVKLSDLGKTELVAQLFISPTDYIAIADAKAGVRAQAMHDLLLANLTLLTPDYVTAAQLTAVQSLITSFVNAKGNTTSLHAVSPVDTKAFHDAFKVVDNIIDSALLMGKAFKDANPEFYDELVKITKLPPVIHRHTILNIKVISKIGGHPVPTAAAEIVIGKTDKKALANEAGLIEFPRIICGQQTATITAPGFKKELVEIYIQRSHENDIIVELEAV